MSDLLVHRKRVYILTADDAWAVEVWHVLWDVGFNPFCPNLLQSLNYNRPIAAELEYRKSWLELCDAVLQPPGLGHEEEVEYAKSLGIPIYDNLDDLIP